MLDLQSIPETDYASHLHDTMIEWGQKRAQALRERQINSEGNDTATLKIIEAALPRLSDEILISLSAHLNGAPGHQYINAMRELEPEKLALMTLKEVTAGALKDRAVSQVVMSLTSAVVSELYYNEILNIDDKKRTQAFKRLSQAVAKKHSNIKKRKEALDRIVQEKYEGIYDEYSLLEKSRIGVWLVIKLVRILQDIFVVDRRSNGQHVACYVMFTERASEAMGQLRSNYEWMRPSFLPITYEPHPWEDLRTGAYHDPRISTRVPMVKARNKEHREILKKADKAGKLRDVKAVLSAIQSVPLEVNPWVTGLVEEAYKRGLTIGSLPRQTRIAVPTHPAVGPLGPLKTTDKDLMRFYRRRAKAIRKNSGVRNANRLYALDMEIAKAFTGMDFFLPANLDFRGRVYSVSSWSHHRSDHIKAQIRFGVGEAVHTQDQADYIAYQVATAGDFTGPSGLKMSKAPLAERIQWTKDNTDLIRKYAANPWSPELPHTDKGQPLWTTADEPFGFMAACQEWIGWIDTGPGYITKLPIAFDGSNSAVQHYACALRSQDLAEKVSLVPSKVPTDVYKLVAAELIKRLEVMIVEGDEQASLARVCLDGIATVGSRSICKRPAMTFGYGSETYGFRDQLLKDFMEPLSDDVSDGNIVNHPFDNGEDDDGYAASTLMAKLLYASVTTILADAAGGMAWFKSVAAILAHEGEGVSWVSPMGLPILHKYLEFAAKRISMTVSDQAVFVHDTSGAQVEEIVLQLREPIPTRVDKHTAKSAVSPNVIHSQDAAHLQLVVKNCLEVGIEDFMLIHDSFATHATKAKQFSKIIRTSMVDMYEHANVFQQIYDAAWGVLSSEGREKLKKLGIPTQGTFDIQRIIDSEFAFA